MWWLLKTQNLSQIRLQDPPAFGFLLLYLPCSEVFAVYVPLLAAQVSLPRVRVSPKPPQPGFALGLDRDVSPELTASLTACS